MLDLLLQLDYKLFTFVNSVTSNSFFDVFFVWITDLHKTTYFKIIVIPLMIFLFGKKFKLLGSLVFLFLLISLAWSDFFGAQIKSLVERPRPEFNTEIQVVKRSDAGHFSFYSNHATNMFNFATYTGHFLPQLKIPFYALAGLVGYSRVYNGVHYPSDVAAGSIIGYLWGIIFSRLTEKILLFIKKRKKLK